MSLVRRVSPDPTNGRAGFTLIEVLVTLAIIGAVGIVTSSMLGGVTAGRVALVAAERLEAEIALLRADAVRSGEPTRLFVDQASQALVSTRAGARPLVAAGMRIEIAAPADRGGATAELRFRPDGSSNGGRVLLETARSTLVLNVSALTARVVRSPVP